jgi:hypothetical protein
MTDVTTESSESKTPQVGRNEPCPCGSKKKYKRCHGVDAAPKLSVSTQQAPALPAGFDPSQFDPNMMLQFSQMMSKLPKGQLQKLQNLMQKAMAGKDVTREAKEFESSLPVEFQTLLGGFQMPGGMPGIPNMGGATGLPDIEANAVPQMTPEEARAIVDAAAKEGKISSEKASELLKEPTPKASLWKKFSGK